LGSAHDDREVRPAALLQLVDHRLPPSFVAAACTAVHKGTKTPRDQLTDSRFDRCPCKERHKGAKVKRMLAAGLEADIPDVHSKVVRVVLGCALGVFAEQGAVGRRPLQFSLDPPTWLGACSGVIMKRVP